MVGAVVVGAGLQEVRDHFQKFMENLVGVIARWPTCVYGGVPC
jgi:hypothetical protein